MQENFIIELLGIKDRNIEVWNITNEPGYLFVELYTKVRKQKCPKCTERTSRIHGYRKQIIQGPILSGRLVKVSLKKRRYLCTHCNSTFYERLQMVQHYQRYTTSLCTTALTYTAVASITTAAKLVGMTTNRVLRIFDRQVITTKKVLPHAIAIDEFKGDAGGERFQTIIVDVENKEILDILPDRKIETIKAYLGSCDTGKVSIVVMDLSQNFKYAVRKALGNPIIIADRFHYMRQVYWALDEVRREVQNELSKEQRINMKRSKKLLWKSPYKLTADQKQQVATILELHPRLQEAYHLKNKIDQWFKESDKHTAQKGLKNCIELMKVSKIEGFIRVAGTFNRWKQEILQSFMYPFNNGYIEGVNNTIKVLKRMSYGIKSFERLKKKILWQQKVGRAY